MDYNRDLRDNDSQTFKEISQILESKIKESLFPQEDLNDPSMRIDVKIIGYE